jgi:hypothetical protein
MLPVSVKSISDACQDIDHDHRAEVREVRGQPLKTIADLWSGGGGVEQRRGHGHCRPHDGFGVPLVGQTYAVDLTPAP